MCLIGPTSLPTSVADSLHSLTAVRLQVDQVVQTTIERSADW
jgi:hypothetical protein